MNNNRISVRIETIRYGSHTLTVAIAINDPQRLFLTFPASEAILNYLPNTAREKIASKSLKSFGGTARMVGEKEGVIVNKPELTSAQANVSLLEFEDFVSLVAWEAVTNQNPAAIALLTAGFADSFRSLTYEQMGVWLSAM